MRAATPRTPSPCRVVVTGVGVASPLGVGRAAFLDGLRAGRVAVRADAAGAALGVPLSAPIDDLGASRWFDARSLRRVARVSQLALVATREALEQAALVGDGAAYGRERIGVVLGTGIGSLRETGDFIRGYLRDGIDQASPLLFPSSVMNATTGQTAIELGLRGPNSTVNHRDASPLDALILAADLLAFGRADAVCVGGVEELNPTMHFAYHELARLTATGIRPWARDRDGTAPGEGAAVLVVEREEDARARGARILARLAGTDARGEARSRVGWAALDAAEAGRSPAAVSSLRAALERAGVAPGEVDLAIGGACGLDLDAIEAAALVEVLGPSVPVCAIAGQIGHSLSGAASRLAAAVLALDHGFVPGTAGAPADDAGLDAPWPGLVRAPREATPRAVVIPSIGQGGSVAAAVLVR